MEVVYGTRVSPFTGQEERKNCYISGRVFRIGRKNNKKGYYFENLCS